jgi:hypothetical protein
MYFKLIMFHSSSIRPSYVNLQSNVCLESETFHPKSPFQQSFLPCHFFVAFFITHGACLYCIYLTLYGKINISNPYCTLFLMTQKVSSLASHIGLHNGHFGRLVKSFEYKDRCAQKNGELKSLFKYHTCRAALSLNN